MGATYAKEARVSECKRPPEALRRRLRGKLGRVAGMHGILHASHIVGSPYGFLLHVDQYCMVAYHE
eukprot:9454153-Prorocentrum_lima.AAC.1